MKTSTGAEILEVFWHDEQRGTVGLLVRDQTGNVWAGEWSADRDGLPHDAWTDIKAAAQVTIRDGTRLEYSATP